MSTDEEFDRGKLKRKIWKLPPSRHVYDIDVFHIIDEAGHKILHRQNEEEEAKDTTLGQHNEEEEMEVASIYFMMLRSIKEKEESFVNDMAKKGIDLTENRKNRKYILPSSENIYAEYLAWKLLLIDVYKIEALLSYQCVRYLGNDVADKDHFNELIEYVVYDHVERMVSANEHVRLEKIMNWVERNRQFMIDKAYSGEEKKTAPEVRIITMNAQFSTILYENLQRYFSEQQHDILFKAIVKGENVNGLCFNGNVNALAEFFKRLRYNEKIEVKTNDILSQWITGVFCVRSKKGILTNLNPETVLNVLKKTQNEPSKGKRILENLAGYILPEKRTVKEPEDKSSTPALPPGKSQL